jgi:hypothetical protein
LDPATAIKDPAPAKKQLAAALTVTNCNVLVSQEAGDDVNYVRLADRVIPELEIFDFANGMPFVTRRFPDLRFCIHTGFDQEDKYGWLPLRHMIIPSNNLDNHIDMSAVTGSTPLAENSSSTGMEFQSKLASHSPTRKSSERRSSRRIPKSWIENFMLWKALVLSGNSAGKAQPLCRLH